MELTSAWVIVSPLSTFVTIILVFCQFDCNKLSKTSDTISDHIKFSRL
jgi:hypothetical protein